MSIATAPWISFIYWLINSHFFCVNEWKRILKFILCSALKHMKQTSCLRDSYLMIQFIKIHYFLRDLCALLCVERNAYMDAADTAKWKKNKLLCCQWKNKYITKHLSLTFAWLTECWIIISSVDIKDCIHKWSCFSIPNAFQLHSGIWHSKVTLNTVTNETHGKCCMDSNTININILVFSNTKKVENYWSRESMPGLSIASVLQDFS